MAPKERAPRSLPGEEPEALIGAKRGIVGAPNRDTLTERDLIPSSSKKFDNI